MNELVLKHKNADKKEIDLSGYVNNFTEAVNDDINIPLALGVVWEMIKLEPNHNIYETLLKFDEVLGLRLNEVQEQKLDVPSEVISLCEERKVYRQEKNWAKSDELRDKILSLGYKVLDSKDGYTLEKV